MKNIILFIKKFWVRESTIPTVWYQRYCILSLFVYSIWALFYPYIDKNVKDGFLDRLIPMSALGLPILLASYFNFKNKTVDLLFTLFLASAVIHHHYLTYINNIHPIYIAGTLLCVTAIQLMVNSFRSFVIINTSSLAFTIVVLLKTQNPYSFFWFLASITLALYGGCSLFVRLKQSDKIIHDAHIIKTDKEFIEIQFRELELRTKQLIQSGKMAALGEMAAGMAHEINNPLTIINTNALLLIKGIERNEFDPDIYKDRLAKIQKTTDRIAKIISGLRTFSRHGENDSFVICNFRQIIEEAIELSKDRLNSHEVELTVDSIPDIQISCRATQILQVLINLLNNAHDAVYNLSHTERWIKINFFIKEKNIQIKIMDGGPGINPEIQEKIFEPFYTTKEVGSGTGLGLSLSKSILAMHQGELSIDQKALHTTFIITLPAVSL